MSRQVLANFHVPQEAWSRVVAALHAAGFEARDQRRQGGMRLLGVVVRTETGDTAEAERIVSRIVPDVRRAPTSVSTMHLKGYREGR